MKATHYASIAVITVTMLTFSVPVHAVSKIDNSVKEGKDPIKMSYREIRRSTPVPEPSTSLLLGSGLAGLLAFRKRFKNKQ